MAALPTSTTRDVLIVSQVYVPDPAAVGQYLADVGAELSLRGHHVVVLTSDRGYDDPKLRYPRFEVLDGVQIHRIPRSSFGKDSIFARAFGAVAFVAQAVVRSLRFPKGGIVIIGTSPPVAPLAGWMVSLLRGAHLKYWVLDLNPDQAIELGVLGKRSVGAWMLGLMSRLALRRATDVITLDRFMAERVKAHCDVGPKLTVIPPWPIESFRDHRSAGENPFRVEHGLSGKFVFMYSGNHSPSNPLATVLAAAKRMTDLEDVVFLFVGGGVGMKEVRAANSPNIRALPYQPKASLKHSLSAPDVHIVSIGDRMVGIVHPSKAYSALAAGRPLLFFGPARSHIGEMLGSENVGWQISHGDVDAAEQALRAIVSSDPLTLATMGETAGRLARESLSREVLCNRLCDVVERVPV